MGVLNFILLYPSFQLPRGRGINLRGYAGRYSRIDVYARAIVLASIANRFAATAGSNIIVRVTAVLPYDSGISVLSYSSGSILGEKEAVFKILKSLYKKDNIIENNYYNSISEWVYELVEENPGKLIQLEETGEDISKVEIDAENGASFLLGPHTDPPAEIIKSIRKMIPVTTASIGPKSLLATHTIAYLLTLTINSTVR